MLELCFVALVFGVCLPLMECAGTAARRLCERKRTLETRIATLSKVGSRLALCDRLCDALFAFSALAARHDSASGDAHRPAE